MKPVTRDDDRTSRHLSILCILILLSLSSNVFSLPHGDIPVIDEISADQIITDSNSATLFASGATDNDRIARVWAVILPPDKTLGLGDSLQKPYTLEFKKISSEMGRYEGTFDGFDTYGTYYIRIYAQDWLGKTSNPGLTTVTVRKPLRSLAIILAGASEDEDERTAIEKSIKLAWDTLIDKGFSGNDLYLLSAADIPGVGTTPVPATAGNLSHAIGTWAKEDAQDLLLYMVGYGDTKEFHLGDGHVVSAVDLNSWLEDLQASLTGKTAVIADAPHSWTYLTALQPEANTDRILISSTGVNQTANFFAQGEFVFSRFFWNSTFFFT